MGEITYHRSCEGIDWKAFRATLMADNFHNGRTAEEYERSARNSQANCFAFDDRRIVGNARMLSDGVCNAYIVDVWTHTEYRRKGIASTMMRLLLQDLGGQHVCLLTDDHHQFYESLGFEEQPVAMSQVIGTWLKR